MVNLKYFKYFLIFIFIINSINIVSSTKINIINDTYINDSASDVNYVNETYLELTNFDYQTYILIELPYYSSSVSLNIYCEDSTCAGNPSYSVKSSGIFDVNTVTLDNWDFGSMDTLASGNLDNGWNTILINSPNKYIFLETFGYENDILFSSSRGANIPYILCMNCAGYNTTETINISNMNSISYFNTSSNLGDISISPVTCFNCLNFPDNIQYAYIELPLSIEEIYNSSNIYLTIHVRRYSNTDEADPIYITFYTTSSFDENTITFDNKPNLITYLDNFINVANMPIPILYEEQWFNISLNLVLLNSKYIVATMNDSLTASDHEYHIDSDDATGTFEDMKGNPFVVVYSSESTPTPTPTPTIDHRFNGGSDFGVYLFLIVILIISIYLGKL